MNDAQRYLDLRKRIPGEFFGPIAIIFDSNYDPIELNDTAVRAASAVVQVDSNTYRAPSPWHAEAWLYVIVNLAAQVVPNSKIPSITLPFDPVLGAPLFRGQRNPNWTLNPTALRHGTAYAEKSFAILQVFVYANWELFKSDDNRMNNQYAHLAAGQHYGLDTTLLDFTLDPHIGVFFACMDAEPGSEVAVYAMPLSTAVKLHAVLVLPPPWLHRVYRQIGVFLDCTKLPDGDFLRPHCAFRILFPADPDYVRDVVSQEKDIILPDDTWYAHAIAWAKERGTKPDAKTATPADLARELEKACGPSPYIMFFNFFHDGTSRIISVIKTIEWLALKLINGTLVYDIGSLEALLRFNEALFREFRVLYKYMLNIGFEREVMRKNRIDAALEAIAGLSFPGDKI